MSPARRTSARRRMFRYRAKRTWKTIPERLKRLIVEPPYHMPREWEDKEPTFVYCETPTMLLLEALGVNEMLWPYYIGYMKRMLALYKNFSGETLLLEIASLIAEYVLRGYDEEVLDEVQLVVEDCSEACYLSCEIVRACLEGDFSNWTVYDRFVDDDAIQTIFNQYAIVNATEDKILLIDANSLLVRYYDIPTKTLTEPTEEYWFPYNRHMEGTIKSVLGTYVVGLIWGLNVRGNGIRILKNASIAQTLTEAQLGFTANRIVGVSISRSGKYVIVSGWLDAEAEMGWVILEGS